MAPRILIVEDEEPLVMLLRYNLEAEGYAVDSAGNTARSSSASAARMVSRS